MRFEDLSPEDQRLVQTDLGEFDKVAAAQLETVNEMYEVGFSKLASETADHLDALMVARAEHAKTASASRLDEESEKYASEYGAFIERGFFDGLVKLGQERHGNGWFYIYPFLEEKVAAAGAEQALEKLGGRAGDLWKAIQSGGGKVMGAVKGVPGKARAAGKAIKDYDYKGIPGKAGKALKEAPGKAYAGAKDYAGKTKAEGKAGYEGLKAAVTGKGVGINPGAQLSKQERMQAAKSGLKNIGKATGRVAAPTVAVGGLGYGGYRALKKKED
jgi:hypothetical protein